MSSFRIYPVACIAFIALIFSHMVEAKDITTLQAAVSFARAEMDKAKAAHETHLRSVTQQQKIIEERKKQLADDIRQLDKAKKDVTTSQKQYLEAKKNLEKAQSNLDQAWGQKQSQ